MAVIESGTKFIGISPNVDTLERKSNQANSPSQVYTIDDLVYVSKPYKVFTALLTQQGTDDPQSFIWTYGDDPAPFPPLLAQGITYYIDKNMSLTDFTVCGAPNNDPGTYFIANGEQPTWEEPDVDGMIRLDWNNAAPTSIILENTIGSVYCTYKSEGLYNVNVPNESGYKLAVFSHPKGYAITGDVQVLDILAEEENVAISTTNGVDYSDFGFTNLSVEIRLYY